jgi:hypothetical protein
MALNICLGQKGKEKFIILIRTLGVNESKGKGNVNRIDNVCEQWQMQKIDFITQFNAWMTLLFQFDNLGEYYILVWLRQYRFLKIFKLFPQHKMEPSELIQ